MPVVINEFEAVAEREGTRAAPPQARLAGNPTQMRAELRSAIRALKMQHARLRAH